MKQPPVGNFWPWTNLVTGEMVSVLDPEPERIGIEAIAYGLAGEYRYSGQTRPRLTVAEHSVLCAELAMRMYGGDRLPLLALLHDAAEGLGLHDLASPIKWVLFGYQVLEDRWMAAVWKAFNIEPPTEMEQQRVTYVDRVVLATEATKLFGDISHWQPMPKPDLQTVVIGYPPGIAETNFLETWNALRS